MPALVGLSLGVEGAALEVDGGSADDGASRVADDAIDREGGSRLRGEISSSSENCGEKNEFLISVKHLCASR